MRILHLGYEDPAQPGSGGGSIRTLEINHRLARRHEVTVVVAGYPGAKRRIENGVCWEPLWPRTGKMIDRLAYFALVGPALQRIPHDLVIEDFGAPFSTAMSPWFTKKPVIASVQWMFANQMREKYHLPFDYVEKKGLRLYQDFIAVSGWLASKILELQPCAEVQVIPNGVDAQAFSVDLSPPRHFLFVGRLDIHQKGLDMLIQVAARTRYLLGAQMPPLLIAGDGPDQPELERQVNAADLGGVVQFIGRVEGRDKFERMAQSYAVVMPSRWETFGIVAAESQAAGAPLVAFDVGPLKEVTGDVGAFLIPPFDLDAFVGEMVRLFNSQEGLSQTRREARQWARKYDWDTIAAQQEETYLQKVAGGK